MTDFGTFDLKEQPGFSAWLKAMGIDPIEWSKGVSLNDEQSEQELKRGHTELHRSKRTD